MAKLNFECKNCKKEFNISYLFLKPAKLNCPYCGSHSISEMTNAKSCGCGSKSDKNSGFRFT